MRTGIDEEMSAARERGMAGSTTLLDLKISVLGVRPAGELPENSPLLAALLAADSRLGNNPSRAGERSSTDANIPLSLGIAAISVGRWRTQRRYARHAGRMVRPGRA